LRRAPLMLGWAVRFEWTSGEEVNYQYDEVGRLIAAATTGPQWGLG